MITDGGESGQQTSEERIQTNSYLASPFVIAALAIALGFLGWQLLNSDPEQLEPTPSTEPQLNQTTTLPPPPPELGDLIALNLEGSLAYAIDGGIGVVNLMTGEIVPITDQLATRLVPGDYVVLQTGDGNFIINKADPTNVALSDIEGDLVSTSAAHRFVAVLFGGVTGGNPDLDARYAFTLVGTYGVEADILGLVSAIEVDKDSAQILVPGLGAVFERSDGGTFVFDVNGYRDLSDHRVVAASAAARVEHRCDPDCRPFYVGPSGNFELPSLFTRSNNMSISPDGQWILLDVLHPESGPTSIWEGAGAQLFEVSRERFVPLSVPEPGRPSWSSDSSVLAWLEPTETAPHLVVVFPDEGTSAIVDLRALGAPDRSGDNLVFVGG